VLFVRVGIDPRSSKILVKSASYFHPIGAKLVTAPDEIISEQRKEKVLMVLV